MHAPVRAQMMTQRPEIRFLPLSAPLSASVILTVGLGLVAIYTSYVVGQVKMKYPSVEHYADAVRLIWGRPGYELCGVMFALFLILDKISTPCLSPFSWFHGCFSRS